MNKLKFLGLTAMSAAMLLTTSCGDDAIPHSVAGDGNLSLYVDLNTSVVAARNVGSRAEATAIEAEDLALTLVSTDGQTQYELGTLRTYDANKKFPIGSYTLVASYGNEGDAGFDKPYYYGESSTVKIIEGETTEATVTAQLANSMFTISYTDALKKYLTEYSAELQTAGTEAIEYPAAETRPVYVKSGKVDVYVNAVKPNGTSARLLAATVSAEPRHHYAVTVDINDGEVGEGELKISFSEELTAEEVKIDLSDELMNAPAPTITTPGATAITYVETTTNKASAKFNAIARGNLARVKLDTTNPQAIASDWPESIDLMSMTEAQKTRMQQLGLSALGVWNNPDKMAVVDLTNVISNATIPASGEKQIKFILTVTDRLGKTNEETAEITVDIKPLEFSIVSTEKLMLGDKELTFDLKYNGENPSGLRFMYLNDRGTWTQATVKSLVEKGDDLYTVTIEVPADGNITLYATNGTISTAQTVAKRGTSDTYAVTATNVFAKSASIAAAETGDVNKGRLYGDLATTFISTDGTTYTKATTTVDDAGLLHLASLQPLTKYYVKVSLTGDIATAPEAAEFITEAAVDIPGGDMEAWTRVNGATSYWWVEYPGADTSGPWATLNLLTTSEGGSSTSAFDSKRNGCSYNAFSGTRATTDCHSGTNAAIIETVGYGQGNSASGSTGANACKKMSVGELYLGTYADGAASYGMTFASRPASMSFYYKYSPKNSADYGYAEITVLDAAGKTLATATKNLTAATAYTQVTMPLAYTTATKAASIKVIFRSSGNASCLTISNNNLSSPNFGNTSTGRFTGSSLYVDDISLNY